MNSVPPVITPEQLGFAIIALGIAVLLIGCCIYKKRFGWFKGSDCLTEKAKKRSSYKKNHLIHSTRKQIYSKNRLRGD